MPCINKPVIAIECEGAKAVFRLSKVVTTMTLDAVVSVSVSPRTRSNTGGSRAKHRDLPLPVGKLHEYVVPADERSYDF